MKPIFYTPHFLLRHAISHFMVVINKNENKPYSSYSPFPPTPQNCINFYPGDLIKSRKMGDDFSCLPESVIIGPQVSKVDLSIGHNHQVISVAFHPGGLNRLLKVPLNQIYDRPVDAADILGNKIVHLNQRLKYAANPNEMIMLIEDYLLGKLRDVKPDPFQRSMYALLHSKSPITLDQAASLSCLGSRQFERRASEVLGYSPKFFLKLIRFSRAYRFKINHPELNWGTIANEYNYFDQAHLIKDFRQLTGMIPTVLFNEMLSSGTQMQKNLKI